MKEWLRNWFLDNRANFITTVRFISSIWLLKLAISSYRLDLMFGLVHVCAASDVADGWVAKKYEIQSKFGGFYDRAVDKVFICPTVTILFYRFWPSILIDSRVKNFTEYLIGAVVLLEAFLIFSGMVSLIKGLNISSNEWGRWKMFFQSAALYAWFLSLVIENHSEIKVLYLSIYFIAGILIVAFGLAIMSIKGYYKTWTGKNIENT